MWKNVRARIDGLIQRNVAAVVPEDRFSPATKISLRRLYHYYQESAKNGAIPPITDTGFRVFSQFEEDGILLFLFAVLGERQRIFIDVGSADGINSNCANLAINFGWHGLFIDGNESSIERGKKFYAAHPDTWAYPPTFVHTMIQRENINQVIEAAGFHGDVGLLSIDIDGNDYWVWEALTAVSPSVVIIETHIEFGLNSIVVPYDKDYVYPGKHPVYHGASPAAMAKLAKKKGYRLVGSNRYGFNTIYVKNGLGDALIPEVGVEEILTHHSHAERRKLFEPIKDWEYVTV